MSRKWLLFPFCLSVLLTLAQISSASLTLRVNESATRVLFEEQGTRVLLSVENSLGRRVDAHVQLEPSTLPARFAPRRKAMIRSSPA
jgi:P pilus assembly chaperone PapD